MMLLSEMSFHNFATLLKYTTTTQNSRILPKQLILLLIKKNRFLLVILCDKFENLHVLIFKFQFLFMFSSVYKQTK
jgi:hypothetical protein